MKLSSPSLYQAAKRLSTNRLFEICGLRPEDLPRLLEKIEERGAADCWPWLGCKRNGGYGNWGVTNPRRNLYPHRLIFAIWNDRPVAKNVLHDCDNRNCCNPHHLQEGTQSQNIQDAIIRGRWTRQGASGKPTLSQEDANEIRRLLALGELSGAAIARKFGVVPSAVVAIRQGRAWTGVDRRYTNQEARKLSDQDVRTAFREAGNLRDTATKLGLSTATVWRRLQVTGGL